MLHIILYTNLMHAIPNHLAVCSYFSSIDRFGHLIENVYGLKETDDIPLQEHGIRPQHKFMNTMAKRHSR